MERTKNFIIIPIFIFLTLPLNGSNRISIYNAYFGNKMNVWKAIVDKMETEKPNKADFILELVNYQYGYIGWCVGNDEDDLAEKYLKQAESNLEWLEKNQISAATINAYKSAFYGFKIGISPVKAPFLGSKSVNHSKLAMEQDSTNPFGYIQYGNSQFHMPAVFGGSKEVALTYFLKALHLMEKNEAEILNDWNYLSLLAIIGQSYEKTGQLEKAKIYYEKALDVEPGFLWVKEELLPEILKKLNASNE